MPFKIPDDVADAELCGWLERAFHPEHQRNFGYRRDSDPILAVSVRVRAIAPARSVAVRDLAASFERDGERLRPRRRPDAAGLLRTARRARWRPG